MVGKVKSSKIPVHIGEVPEAPKPRGRRCACGVRLSQYNVNDECNVCLRRHVTEGRETEMNIDLTD